MATDAPGQGSFFLTGLDAELKNSDVRYRPSRSATRGGGRSSGPDTDTRPQSSHRRAGGRQPPSHQGTGDAQPGRWPTAPTHASGTWTTGTQNVAKGATPSKGGPVTARRTYLSLPGHLGWQIAHQGTPGAAEADARTHGRDKTSHTGTPGPGRCHRPRTQRGPHPGARGMARCP